MNKTVLIVEDDTFILETVARRFRESSFTVQVAKNAVEAQKILSTTPPDVILLDIILPEMNGLDLLKKLKDDSKTTSIPVIIFSNLGSPEDIKKATDAGASDYLVKASFTPDEVVEKVTKFLNP